MNATSRARDAAGRVVRGGIQFGTAETLVRFAEAFFIKLNEDQHIALLGILTLLVSLAQNLLENANYLPRLMRPKTQGN